ncbi:hypothetical protein B0J12DRAFT_763273 [Macrophomina phaseolina]|uniref:Uncharacterized protein n=1 Tax=Macrophomina phaseolina TaxID=35725 RepID=A0ABQ8GQE9_9PEZI|nr:hypothetical protein B0J12DRAFT_763273 [Macrophomina phaseolina]
MGIYTEQHQHNMASSAHQTSPPPSPSPDSFPHFRQGDVQIILTPVEKLRLHSDVLRNGSTLLSTILTPDNAAVLAKKALADSTHVRFRLELVDVSKSLGESPGRLALIKDRTLTEPPTPQKLDANGHPIRSRDASRVSMYLSSHGADPALRPVLGAWKAVLGTMYGQEMHVQQQQQHDDDDDDDDDDGDDEEAGGRHDLGALIRSASTILDIVDYLGLRSNIFAPLELALLANEQALWQSIAAAPIAWAELGARLRSFPVWREAVVHVVGGWATWEEEERGALDGRVRALVEGKVEWYEGVKERLETRLLEYRHEKLRFAVGKEPGKGKKQHEPDVFYWQAQWLWSDWLARRFREGMGRRARDGGWRLYHLIWMGEWADPRTQKMVSPLTPSGMKVVTAIVDEMKAELKKMVASFMTSTLKLDQKEKLVERLTSSNIEFRSAPWYSRGLANKRKKKRQRVEDDLQLLPDENDKEEEEEEGGDDDNGDDGYLH